MARCSHDRPRKARAILWLGVVSGFLACDTVIAQSTPPAQTSPPQPVLSLQAALEFALENHPALATQRKQRGVASARVVIADLYPFNPVFENRIQKSWGPESAGITNAVPVENLILLELEIRHQRTYRRQAAAAAFSRTEWEIAFQEQTVAVDVLRAYTALLYRQEKLRLMEATFELNNALITDVQRLIDAGAKGLKQVDLIQARTEMADSRDQVGAGREAVTAARQDLLRAIGAVATAFTAEGTLDSPGWSLDESTLTELALSRRADLKARQMAAAEACAATRLVVANRYGNPTVGTAYTYDPSRVSQLGVQVNIPIPVFNNKRGDVAQAEAEQAIAIAQMQQAEVTVKQDVAVALAKLSAANQRAELTRTKTLPELRQSVDDMLKLFQAGEPGVDVRQLIDVRRKLIKARDGYLDALWSVRQARIDIAAATGEPALELAGSARPPAK
jgi:cobalt-zinc-cadmium efflux system outer membrane protein